MPENASPTSGRVWIPQATVFVSSFCIMVIELVAGRIISRHLGASLYTWTSVIGIVLGQKREIAKLRKAVKLAEKEVTNLRALPLKDSH